jgi:hypothetical protein
VNEPELGDRDPFELLRQIKALAGDHVDDQMFETLWLHRLPLNVQLPHLAQRWGSSEENGQHRREAC